MDYVKVGLKAGLEIHQQLDTGKLFSRTPSYLRKDEPHFFIKRKLHKVAGETGEVDTAVEYEASLKKEFVYEGYNDTISLVELDESPPQKIDSDALDEALKIATLLNCKIFQTTQIMRKTVIDGSNTSGFQRTVLIARDGWLDISAGKVPVESICLEEDSARLISKDEKSSRYRLDRLGIPLVEIATAPVLQTPEQIKECALKLGEILRACKVKRGIGTIRQDLNISIKGHEKVEIKGFQEPRIMTKTVELEVQRQLDNLTKKKTSGEVRNSEDDGTTKFLRPLPGKDRMYPETDLPLLKISREKINEIKKKLPKLRADIKSELKNKGVSEELVPLVLENLEEFEILSRVFDKDANLLAKMITLWRSELVVKTKKTPEQIKEELNESVLEKILEAVRDEKIEISDVKSVMENIASGAGIAESLKIKKISDDEMEEEISKIIREKPGLRPNAYMGLVMAKFKGKLDAKKAMEIISRIAEG